MENWYRHQAECQYASEGCDIDDNARVVMTGTGAWIAAWVFIPKPPDYEEEELLDMVQQELLTGGFYIRKENDEDQESPVS